MSSLHFSSSHMDGVSTARLCAGVARGALLLSSPASRSPSLKGKGDVSSDHDAPRVREGGLHWGQCRCPSTGVTRGGLREEVTPHHPPSSLSYQGPLGQNGKGPSEAWSRTHEGPKGGITFKSKKQARGEGQGNSSYTHAASRTVSGCPQSR